jgi:hypothetical protein
MGRTSATARPQGFPNGHRVSRNPTQARYAFFATSPSTSQRSNRVPHLRHPHLGTLRTLGTLGTFGTCGTLFLSHVLGKTFTVVCRVVTIVGVTSAEFSG